MHDRLQSEQKDTAISRSWLEDVSFKKLMDSDYMAALKDGRAVPVNHFAEKRPFSQNHRYPWEQAGPTDPVIGPGTLTSTGAWTLSPCWQAALHMLRPRSIYIR